MRRGIRDNGRLVGSIVSELHVDAEIMAPQQGDHFLQ